MGMRSDFKIAQNGSRRFLLLQGAWTSEAGEFMRSNGLSDLRLSAYAGWRERQIDFLKEIPFLERLDLMAVGIRDISPLYELHDLRKLSISGVKKQIDFTKIPALEELRIGWNAKTFSSLLDCEKLRVLGIDRYSGKDLRSFEKLKVLEVLAVAFSAIESLSGIENFSELLRLSLAVTNRLETLDGVEKCEKLNHLSIETAKSLRRINAVEHLRELRELTFSACPHLETIRHIRGLPQLEYVCLLQTTRIDDGDLSVLKTLPRLKHASFVNRKNYNHRTEEFPKAYRTSLHWQSMQAESLG